MERSEEAGGRALLVRPPEDMRYCEGDLERVLVFEQERKTYGNWSIADDTASGLIERKRETRRGITHERDRKGAADAPMI